MKFSFFNSKKFRSTFDDFSTYSLVIIKFLLDYLLHTIKYLKKEYDKKMENLTRHIQQMKKEKLETKALLNQNMSLHFNTDRIKHIKNSFEEYLKLEK